MTDSLTGQRPDELLYNLPAQPTEPEIKWSWPTYEVQREYFDRRDDSLRARKFARHLDTFRQVPPDDRDIQRLAERHGARYLMIQVCANGTPQANRTVWREVMQDARVIGGEQHATQQLAQHVVAGAANMPTQPETVTPHALSGLANTAREFKDLATVLNPPAPAAPALTAADIERIAADAAARAVEQYKATQTAAPVAATIDPIKMVREIAALQKELLPPTQTATAQPDAAESFLSQFEKFSEISERIAPIRERDDAERGWFDKILGTVGDIAKAAPDLIEGLKLAKPLMPARIQALMAGADASDAAPPEQTQPQATAAQAQPTVAAPATPKDETEAFQLILHVAVADLTRNKRIGRVADLVEEMCRRFPTLNATIDQLCSLTPESALATLESYAQRTDLASLSHSIEWVMNLQDELRPDDEGGDPDGGETQPVAVPNIVDMASAQTN